MLRVLCYSPWSSESSWPVLLSLSDPGPPTMGVISPGANELLFASGVAAGWTPPEWWCFRPPVPPGAVAVVLVLLSSSSSSSVPDPSSDSASTMIIWFHQGNIAILRYSELYLRIVSIFKVEEWSKPTRSRWQAERLLLAGFWFGLLFVLEREAICSSERPGFPRTTRLYNPKSSTLHRHHGVSLEPGVTAVSVKWHPNEALMPSNVEVKR